MFAHQLRFSSVVQLAFAMDEQIRKVYVHLAHLRPAMERVRDRERGLRLVVLVVHMSDRQFLK